MAPAGSRCDGCTRRSRRRHRECPPRERATPPLALARHERMAVAMALAESTHHSAHRQKTPKGRERGTRCTARPRSGSASRVLRHVVGHLSVPALDVPVPQMVDQLPDIEQFFRVLNLILSKLSKYPRSCLSMSLCARLCASRSWIHFWSSRFSSRTEFNSADRRADR